MPSGGDSFYTRLGRHVQQLRKQRALTQEQLGARLVPQVTRASIANVESGKQRVLAHTLAQIAEALEVTADDLIKERSVLLDHDTKQQLGAELQDRLQLTRESLESLSRKLGLGELSEEGREDATTDKNRNGAKGGGGSD